MDKSRKQIAKDMKSRIAVRDAYEKMMEDYEYPLSIGDIGIATKILQRIKDANPDMYEKLKKNGGLIP